MLGHHVSEARWEVMACMIMDKEKDYVNGHDDLNLTLYGRVLKARARLIGHV